MRCALNVFYFVVNLHFHIDKHQSGNHADNMMAKVLSGIKESEAEHQI